MDGLLHLWCASLMFLTHQLEENQTISNDNFFFFNYINKVLSFSFLFCYDLEFTIDISEVSLFYQLSLPLAKEIFLL